LGTRDEVAQLPLGRHFWRQCCGWCLLSDDAEDFLSKLRREQELGEAPPRVTPRWCDHEDDGLAAVRCRLEGLLTPLARGKAARRRQIEEKIVPAVALEPSRQRQRLGVVRAGVADENLRHADFAIEPL